MSLNIWLSIFVDVGTEEPYEVNLYDDNITSNLNPMWRQAGVYDALHLDGKIAQEILPVLRQGLADMQAKPEVYKALNPENGWGDYEGAIDFLQNLIAACQKFPKACVFVNY